MTPSRMTLKRLSLSLVAASLAGMALAGTAQAQMFMRPFFYGGTWSGPVTIPEPQGPRRLPRALLFEEIADQGYRPLSVIASTAETVTVDVLDARARRLRLTVDAFDGEILARRPMIAARPGALERPVPEGEGLRPARPRPKATQAPKTAPPAGTPSANPQANPQAMNPQAVNPQATPKKVPPQEAAPAEPPKPVAPARDPSQWGKEG